MKKGMIVIVGMLCGVGMLFSGCGKKQEGNTNTGKVSAENATSTKASLPKKIVKMKDYTDCPTNENVAFDPSTLRPGTMEYVFWQYMQALNKKDWEKSKTFAAESCKWDAAKESALNIHKDLNKYKYFRVHIRGDDIDPANYDKKKAVWFVKIYAFVNKPKDRDAYDDEF